jgi:hypothetical protein
MVQDRPEMARVRPPDPIWRYCVRAFAGEAIGQRVSWNPVEPTGFDMYYEAPLNGNTPCIRMRRASSVDPEYGTNERWYRAVWCFQAMRTYLDGEALRRKGLHGDLSRDEWVRGATRRGYEQLHRIRQVYRTCWRPTAASRHLKTLVIDRWATDLPSSFDAWYAGLSSQNREEYAQEYDGRMAQLRSLSLELKSLKSVRQVLDGAVIEPPETGTK